MKYSHLLFSLKCFFPVNHNIQNNFERHHNENDKALSKSMFTMHGICLRVPFYKFYHPFSLQKDSFLILCKIDHPLNLIMLSHSNT